MIDPYSVWSCPGCGCRYEIPRNELAAYYNGGSFKIGIWVRCFKCAVSFALASLVKCQLIGLPLPFDGKINRLFDGE